MGYLRLKGRIMQPAGLIFSKNEYLFSLTMVFATIPKACGFEAATQITSILLGGSLIPIVVIGMGMAFSRKYDGARL